jgi:hypothetical protein
MTRLTRSEWFFAAAIAVCTAVLLFSLLGCAAPVPPPPKPIVTPVQIRVPVPVTCLTASQVPERPALAPDDALKALPDYELVITIEQQRRLLREYEARAAALLAACTDVSTDSKAGGTQ